MNARKNRLAQWAHHAATGQSHDDKTSDLPRDWLRRIRIAALAIALTLLGAGGIAGGWAFYVQQSGNVHAVEPGLVYRSNTLGQAQLRQVLADNGIRSIINLRGGSDRDAWYRSEGEIATALGVTRIDIPLSDSTIPSPKKLASLVDALKNSPKPVLIHCQAGADRTGLASALYEYLIAHKPADVAAGQLSFFYGHFPWYPSHTGAMDDAFWAVVKQGQ